MKSKIKNKIISAFKQETPNLKDEIIKKCEQQTQLTPKVVMESPVVNRKMRLIKRFVFAFSLVVLFATGLITGYFITRPSNPIIKAETYLYIDVNPSIEIALDENNVVLQCVALNEEAMLVTEGFNFEGVELNTALNALISSMYLKGFLDEVDNSMLVSVDIENNADKSAFLSYITTQINEVFTNSQMQCSIIAQSLSVSEDLKNRAKEQGISVGKMFLIDKMAEDMGSENNETIDILADMSIKELNIMYSSRPNNGEPPKGDVVSGNIGGVLKPNEVLNLVLEYMGKTLSAVQRYDVFARPTQRGDIRVIYAVILMVEGDEKVYEYEVDCITGEIFEDSFEGYPRIIDFPEN